jgi:hypothetical protein
MQFFAARTRGCHGVWFRLGKPRLNVCLIEPAWSDLPLSEIEVNYYDSSATVDDGDVPGTTRVDELAGDRQAALAGAQVAELECSIESSEARGASIGCIESPPGTAGRQAQERRPSRSRWSAHRPRSNPAA